MSQPEIALLMSTYQRPAHLRRALESIALQQGVDGRMELVVTDDGSTDETPTSWPSSPGACRFASASPRTSTPSFGCRAAATRASEPARLRTCCFSTATAFCPATTCAQHLAHRRPHTVMAGDCCRLDEETSARVTLDVVRSGEFTPVGPADELKRLRKIDRSSRFYRLIRHPTKPKMIGNNVGIWRRDYERVNGYDENYRGLGLRGRRPAASAAQGRRGRGLDPALDAYLPSLASQRRQHAGQLEGRGQRRLLPAQGPTDPLPQRTGKALARRSGDSHGGRPAADRIRSPIGLARRFGRPEQTSRPKSRFWCCPGKGRFSGRADCNVLVALDPAAADVARWPGRPT